MKKTIIFPVIELMLLLALSFISAYITNSGNLTYITISCYILLFLSIFLRLEELVYLIAFVLPVGNLFKFKSGLMLVSALLLVYVIKSVIVALRQKDNNYSLLPLIILFSSFIISIFSSIIINTSLQLQLVFYFHLFFIFQAVIITKIYKEDTYYNILFFFF